MRKFFLILSTFTMVFSAWGADNVTALKMALDDEYKAKATYLQVIEDFGDRRPFSNIVKSEQRHIDALLPFFQKYGVAVPSNPYLGNVPSYNSRKEACKAGVQGEIANVALYDKIFSMTDDAALIKVFEQLQWASQNNHLPAFTRCASGGRSRPRR